MNTFNEPTGIAIDICYSCNNNCTFCANIKGFDLSSVEIMKMMLEIKKFSQGIILNGGEPSIRKDIVNLVSFAKKIGFTNIIMISNGRMFSYEKFCKKLCAAGLTLAYISINSSDSKLHDSLTLVKNSFNETVQGIINLKACGLQVCTNTVINKLNYKMLADLPYLLSEHRIDFAKISFLRTKGNAELNQKKICLSMSQSIPYVKTAIKNFIKLNMNFIIQEIPPCLMHEYAQYIKKGPKMPLSLKGDALEVSKFLKKYRREGNIKRLECYECVYNNTCLGPWKEYIKYFGWEEFIPVTAITKDNFL